MTFWISVPLLQITSISTACLIISLLMKTTFTLIKTGTGTFTVNEAIAKLGGELAMDNEYIKVEIDGTRIGFNPDTSDVVYINSFDANSFDTNATGFRFLHC